MSVIVTGMDMPNGCLNCKYHNDEVGFCSLVYKYIPTCFTKTNKGYCCPLKSINELIEKITQLPTQENAEGQDMYQAYDVLRTIREYCEVKE